MIISYTDPRNLLDFEKNAKVHPEAQIESIKASIEQFGFVQPIVIDENGTILAGHGRRQAAVELGMSEVPVVEITTLTESEKLLLCTIDNDLHRQANEDKERFVEALSTLEDGAQSLGAFGIYASEYMSEVETLKSLSFIVPVSEYEEIEKRLRAEGDGDLSLGFLRILEAADA